MVSSVFAEKIQPQLLLVQKIVRNIALSLLLVSVVIPFYYGVINTQAQSDNSINPNTKVTVEKVMKDNSKEIKQVTLQELQSDAKLVDLGNTSQNETGKVSLKLTPDLVKEIEAKKGVVLEKEQVLVNKSVLTSLGYNVEEIATIQNLVQNYNLQPVKERIIRLDNDLKHYPVNDFFTVKAKAATCDPYIKTDYQWWGFTSLLSNCLIQDFNTGALTASTIVGVVYIAGYEPTPLGELIILYLGLYIGAININNERCNNNGVYFTTTYATLATGWVSAVC